MHVCSHICAHAGTESFACHCTENPRRVLSGGFGATLVSDISFYLIGGLPVYVCVYAQANTKVQELRARMGSKGTMNTSNTGYERKGGHSLGFTRGEITRSAQFHYFYLEIVWSLSLSRWLGWLVWLGWLAWLGWLSGLAGLTGWLGWVGWLTFLACLGWL